MGRPTKITILDSKGFVTSSDIVTLKIHFKNNKTCLVYINRVSILKKRLNTFITKKNCFVWADDVLYKFSKKRKIFVKSFESKKTPLEIECQKFINLINTNKIDFSNAKKAITILQLITKGVKKK